MPVYSNLMLPFSIPFKKHICSQPTYCDGSVAMVLCCWAYGHRCKFRPQQQCSNERGIQERSCINMQVDLKQPPRWSELIQLSNYIAFTVMVHRLLTVPRCMFFCQLCCFFWVHFLPQFCIKIFLDSTLSTSVELTSFPMTSWINIHCLFANAALPFSCVHGHVTSKES